MAVETKLDPNHGSMAARIAKRLNDSGAGAGADEVVKKGEGPTRTVSHVHHGGYRHNSRNNSGGDPPEEPFEIGP
jgi:hypothetical protein